MSFGILQSFLHRLEMHGTVDGLPELSNLYRQFQAHDNSYEQVVHEIIEEERPPMITLPEYREKFGISGSGS